MISVIMGVYNGEKTVRKAVQSILDSDYKDLEFVVVDDGSSDNSFEILSEMQSQDERIVLIQNEKNSGLTYSLNKALEIAKGEYIARQDADDVSYSNRLSVQLEFLENNKNFDFVGAGAKLVDQDGKMWGTRFYPSLVTKKELLKYNPFIHPSLLIRRDVLDAIGGYRDIKQTLRCEDYDLIFRLYANGYKGYNIPKILLDYFEDKDSAKRHSFKTRHNEHYVRMYGSKLINGGFKGYLLSFKPIVLAMIDQKTYNRLHNGKWKRKNDELSADIAFEQTMLYNDSVISEFENKLGEENKQDLSNSVENQSDV